MARGRKSGKRISAVAGGTFGKTLEALLSTIKEHEKGSQMHLRDDMANLYSYANDLRDDPEKFAEFRASRSASQLKRQPKTAEQILRAVMNLAYPAKLASARFRRLKTSWDARLPPDDVREDLQVNGASRTQLRLEFVPAAVAKFGLHQLPAGSEVGFSVWAKVVSHERLACEILEVLEWPD